MHRLTDKKEGKFPCPECFHNGIILIVICFKVSLNGTKVKPFFQSANNNQKK